MKEDKRLIGMQEMAKRFNSNGSISDETLEELLKCITEENKHPNLWMDDVIIARSESALDNTSTCFHKDMSRPEINDALLSAKNKAKEFHNLVPIPSQGTKEERLAAGLADQARKQDEVFARVLKANEESLNGETISMPEDIKTAEEFSDWIKGI